MTKEKKGGEGVSKFYQVTDSKVERMRRGVFMAAHKDRLTCGKCSYTEFQKEQTKKPKQ